MLPNVARKLLAVFILTLVGPPVATAQVLFESLHDQFQIATNPFTFQYNNTQVVRHGDDVYLLYNDDDDGVANLTGDRCELSRGKVTIFKKTGNGAWTKGSKFPFTAGGLLVTPDGYVHVYGYFDGVSQCTPIAAVGGISLWKSTSPGAVGSGQWLQSWVYPPPSSLQVQVTGRLGGATDIYGNLYFSDGIASDGVCAWVKAPNWPAWTQLELENTASDWFPYPMVHGLAPYGSGFFATFHARAWDSNNDGRHDYDTNKLLYPNGDWTWSETKITDCRYRQKGVYQGDILVDSQGRLHVLSKVCNTYGPTNGGPSDCQFDHLTYPINAGPIDTQQIQYYAVQHNALVGQFKDIRLVEVDGRIFYLAGNSSNEGGDAAIYHMEATGGTAAAPNYGWKSLPVPAALQQIPNSAAKKKFQGVYMYISVPRGGGDADSDYIDVLAIDGQHRADGLAICIRIPASVLFAP